MKKIILLGLLFYTSCSSTSNNGSQKEEKPKLNCNSAITLLMDDRSGDCIEIKNALIEFNIKAYNAVKANSFFASDIVSYFSNPPFNMGPSEIISMVETLKTSFENTGKLLKMIKKHYGNYQQGLSPAFYSLGISAANSEILTKYTLNNF